VPNEYDEQEFSRILMHIGEVLRLDLDKVINEPPPDPVMRQMIKYVRSRQDQLGPLALSRVPHEELPPELQRLLEQIFSAEQYRGPKGPLDL